MKRKRDHQDLSSGKNHEGLTKLPSSISGYTKFRVPPGLPSLPLIKNGSLSTAPFRHKSMVTYDRSASTKDDMTYERLEFLGDAYLEVIASRLLFERFEKLPTGQLSQLRELLVKNETLAEYSRAYGFDKQVEVDKIVRTLTDDKFKGNKGFNKVLGDVFEAYVAAVILSDAEDGFSIAEKWLTALWAPKLLEATSKNGSFYSGSDLSQNGDVDPLNAYDPTAKQQLQTRILCEPYSKLEYETWRDSLELKGDQLGQNKHFIALYLTGFGYERKLLGKGEGKNKLEAGNWAATHAMHGECKGIVDECEEKLKQEKAAKKAKREKKRIPMEVKEEK